MTTINETELAHIITGMSYTVSMEGTASIRVFPPSSGRKMESPPSERVSVPVYDCRPIATDLTLDDAGFELRASATEFRDYYDPERVRSDYYPEVVRLLTDATGAEKVFVFDHNVRNQPRSERKEHGVRQPVDGAHNDYTLSSGPRRIREVLADNDMQHLADRRAALINVWRPIVGPVQDHPLAICHARTTKIEDFIPTEIQHFLEHDLEEPHLTGEVYSFRHSPEHRWYYVSDMQPHEVMLLKCFDTATDGRACFTGHTGFRNPDCPPEFTPRESIEARTVVVFPEHG